MYIQRQKEFNARVGLGKHTCAHCKNLIGAPPVIIDVNQRFYHAGCAMQLVRDILAAFGELYTMTQRILPAPPLAPAAFSRKTIPEPSTFRQDPLVARKSAEEQEK